MIEASENYRTGFISIYRSIKKHWIWSDEKKLKWWLDILLSVNYSDNKVSIGFDIVECRRGQSVQSLKNWAEQWKTSKDSARHFLKMLEKDNMITLENLTKTTRLTVCNYDDYQIDAHANQALTKREPNEDQTQTDPNNKENKENNILDREKIFQNEILKFTAKYDKDMLSSFFIYWSEKNQAGKKMRFELQQTWDTGKRLATWKRNNDKFSRK